MLKERNTKQKEILINYFKENKNKHVTISDIKNKLGADVGVTTIYRMVNSMIKKGQISRIPLENKQGFCYLYSGKEKNCNLHYHLICECCGKLQHFESKKVSNVINEAKNSNDFNIDAEKITFYGKCNNCKCKDNGSKK